MEKKKKKKVSIQDPSKVEAPIIDHLRDSALGLEKYEAMQNYPMYKEKK